MRDRQPTESERTWVDDLLGSPGVRDLLEQGNTVEMDAQWGGESTASGTATGDSPTLDLGGVSGEGGGSVQTLIRHVEGMSPAIPVALGGLAFLAVAAWMFYRGRFLGAAIFGTLGACTVAGSFWWPAWLIGGAIGLVGLFVLARGDVLFGLTKRVLGDVVTAVDSEPAARDAVKIRMQNNDAAGKRLVKKARADAAKRKGSA